MLELTAQIARRLGKRWGIYHMDYEAQYQLTTDYVRETLTATATRPTSTTSACPSWSPLAPRCFSRIGDLGNP